MHVQFHVSLPHAHTHTHTHATLQIPLGLLTNLPFMRGQIGNIMVWIGIVLGQPLAILMYLHDYYWIHWAPLEDSVVNATNFM